MAQVEISDPTRSDAAILEKIKTKETKWNATVFKRMDVDEKLWLLDEFKLTDTKGDELEDVQHVTMNTPRVLGERILAVLNESEEHIVIKGRKDNREMTDEETHLIESFLKDVEYEYNQRIIKSELISGIMPYWWEQICFRGRVGTRCLVSQTEGDFLADVFPPDMRSCTFQLGSTGLKWVGYSIKKTKEEIKEEYNEPITADEGTVRDFWDELENIGFVDEKQVDRKDNPLGYPPFVIVLVNAGTFFGTSNNAIERQGDSIFSANRNLYPHENTLASVMQTQNFLTVAPAQVIYSKSGKKLPKQSIYRIGRILALETGEKIEKIDAPDIQSSTRFFSAILGGAEQRGGISHIDWGNLQFQLSQVAIATLASASRQVYTPRLQAMSVFKSQLARMIIDQFVAASITAKIGKKGEQTEYTPEMFAGDYTIEYEYFTTLPEETAAAYGLAAAAARWFDDETIRRNILHDANPTDSTEKYDAQTAKRVSRILALLKMAKALEAQGEVEEAKVLLAEMGALLEGMAEKPKELTEGAEPGVAEPAPDEAAAILQKGQEVPPGRTTRKTEAPGAGELEEEVTA